MKKMFLTGMIALLGVSLFFLGCKTESDDTPPAPTPIVARTATVTPAGGENTLAVTATGGALAAGLKAYVKTADGTEVVITKAASLTDFTEYGNVTVSGLVITLSGLTDADASGGPEKLNTNGVAITLAADAQTAQVTSISAAAATLTAVINSSITPASNDTIATITAADGALAGGLKVYIKDDGTAITITKAASVTSYTEYTGSVAVSGLGITISGLMGADSTGSATTLDIDGAVTVTLAIDAQTVQVSSLTVAFSQ
jgi:hypothetical protein